jgi:hypothetical protein
MAGLPVVVGASAGPCVVKINNALDRAAFVLGLVSVISAVFVFASGEVEIVRMQVAGVVVALVLGLLAIAAGWLASRALILAAGAGFLVAAAAQMSLLTGGSSGFLGGNASTFSLWLGLGVGLIAIGMVPRPDADAEDIPET